MKNATTHISRVSRFIVGIVFIFSGFVKIVDPLGTAYKFEEYFNVFGMSQLLETMPLLPLAASILLCSIELLLGLLLVLCLFRESTAWLLVLMMTIFTILTFIDAVTHKVSDCGCFGDAITLTNWQTFWKNIILDFFTVFIFLKRKNRCQCLSRPKATGLALFFFFIIVSFGIANYMFEPMIDFRPWKEGNRMVPKEQLPTISYALYKNNDTGEEREFSMDDLMKAYEQDAEFAQRWQWISTRTLNETTIAAKGFSMIPIGSDKDVSLEYLYNNNFIFLITSYDLKQANASGMKKIIAFAESAKQTGYPFALLTASTSEECLSFVEKYTLSNIMLYSTDDKAIKTMMRSNPGLILMKNGVVLKKWSARNIPLFEHIDFDDLALRYSEQ